MHLRLSSFALGLLLSAPAFSQNALDHNLQRGPGASRVNPAAPRVDYRARNEDVTGTLAGGRSFRGDVGYRASGDFWAPTGADAIQRPLSYSAYSDPALFNSPLRNDQYRVADGLGVYQYRRQYSSLPLYTSVDQADALVDRQIRLDRSTAALMSGNLYSTAVGSTQVGLIRDAEQGTSVVSASPISGLRMQPLTDPYLALNLSPFERAQMVEDVRSGAVAQAQIGMPFRNPLSAEEANPLQPPQNLQQSAFDPNRADTRFATAGNVGRVEGSAPGTDPAYERIVERILTQYAERTDVSLTADGKILDSVRARLDLLRMDLRGEFSAGLDESETDVDILLPGDAMQGGTEEDPGIGQRLPGGVAPLPGLGELQQDPLGDPEDDSDPLKIVPPERTLTIEEMAEVLRHGRLVQTLTEGERTRVRELIEEGQAFVGKGDFFRAERRFDNALRMQPDQPMAMAGLASAQIGAGLYLSASLSLRKLFTDYPEMIDTRYAEELLPSRNRLNAVARTCRERIELGRDIAGYGLTLAYIGHQLGDEAMVTDGLMALSDDPDAASLRRILRAVWLSPETSGQ